MTVDTALEALRSSFRPDTVRVLFIGESPPAGVTFFYLANSNLARCTQDAFKVVFGETAGTGQSFLSFFKNLGCYLDDLCPQPINHVEKSQRRLCHAQAVDGLAARLHAYSPQVIVIVKKDIERFVEKARDQAGIKSVKIEVLPFPAMGHQTTYQRELEKIIRSLQRTNILPSS